jgi:hypothetical protein
MLTLKESLNHYTTSQLKKEISKYNKSVKIAGYSKLNREDIIKLMLYNERHFKHLILDKVPEPIKKGRKNKKEVKKSKVKLEVKPVEPEVKVDEKIKNEEIVKLNEIIKSSRSSDIGNFRLNKVFNEAYKYLNDTEKEKYFRTIKDIYESFREKLLKQLDGKDNYGINQITNLEREIFKLEKHIPALEEMIKNKKNLKTKKARENALPVIAKYEQEIKDSEENIKDLSYRLDKIKEEIKKAKEISFNTINDFSKYQTLESVRNHLFWLDRNRGSGRDPVPLALKEPEYDFKLEKGRVKAPNPLIEVMFPSIDKGLQKYTLKQLKDAIVEMNDMGLTEVEGFSQLSRPEIIELIVKNPDYFGIPHLKMIPTKRTYFNWEDEDVDKGLEEYNEFEDVKRNYLNKQLKKEKDKLIKEIKEKKMKMKAT